MTEKILYQHGTLGALMAGLMDGTETIAHILELIKEDQMAQLSN